jgi:hypothetical protein
MIASQERRDCGVVALAIAAGVDYDTAHEALRRHGRRRNCCTYRRHLHAAAKDLGARLVPRCIRKPNGGRYSVRTVADGLKPRTAYILHAYDHWIPFTDGQIRDWTAGRLHLVKEVYEVIKK